MTKARKVDGFSLDDVLDSTDVGREVVADKENPMGKGSGVTNGRVHRPGLCEHGQQTIPLPVRALSSR
jgi:hypothetical protein